MSTSNETRVLQQFPGLAAEPVRRIQPRQLCRNTAPEQTQHISVIVSESTSEMGNAHQEKTQEVLSVKFNGDARSSHE